MKKAIAILFILAACTAALADGGSIPLCPPGHVDTSTNPPTCKHGGMQ